MPGMLYSSDQLLLSNTVRQIEGGQTRPINGGQALKKEMEGIHTILIVVYQLQYLDKHFISPCPHFA